MLLILGEPAAADSSTPAPHPEAMSSTLLGCHEQIVLSATHELCDMYSHASTCASKQLRSERASKGLKDCHTTEASTDYRILARCLSPIIIFSDPALLNEFLNGFTSFFSSAVEPPENVSPLGGKRQHRDNR